ncbi:MAG: SH3 domain-containing protein [Cyanobacteria bacterium J06635_1]
MTTGIERLGSLKVNGNDTTIPIKIRWQPNGEQVKTTRPHHTQVTVLGEKPVDVQGYTWYKISYGSGPNDTGWVRNDVITLQPPTAPSEPDNTQLYFETDSRKVRVFIENNLLLMNVYNKSTQKNEATKITALRLPVVMSTQGETTSAWRTYIAHQDGLVYMVRYEPRARTELIRSGAVDGIVIDRESGFGGQGFAYERV